MSRIVSFTKKLQLLEKTHEIEEEERERVRRTVAERNSKYMEIKSKNGSICSRTATELELKREASERKALLNKLKESISNMPWMHPMVDLLENSQCKLYIVFY